MAWEQPLRPPIGPSTSIASRPTPSGTEAESAHPPPAALEQCPLCTYPVLGLPVQGRCPECGTELDLRWIVFGGRHRTRAARRYGPSFRTVLVALLIHTLLLLGAVALLTGAWQVVAIPLVAFGAVWVLLRPGQRFVAIGPEGLYIWRGPRRQSRHAWAELGRAERMALRKAVRIEHRSQPVILGLSDVFGHDPAEADRFVATFNQYRPEMRAACTAAG